MKKTVSEFTKPYLEALGSIVVNMSKLESAIRVCISLLIDSEFSFVKVALATDSFSKLLDVYDNIINFRMWDEKQKEKSKILVSELRRLNELRNKYIHSHWNISDEGQQVIRQKYLKHLKIEIDKNVSVDELIKCADDIDKIVGEMVLFSMDSIAIIRKQNKKIKTRNKRALL